MINNGGYAVVDCKGCNLLAQSAQTISGLYADCTAAIKSGKPAYAINCNYGEGVPITPIQVFGINEAGTYIFTASILQIRVTSADSVTITSLIPAANASVETRKSK